jgi:alpha-beta hydrolase superfamily lysophospholipase
MKPNNKNNKYNTALIFSHGRTATPLMYSQILLQFAQRDLNVFAVQHTEKTDTKLT